MGCIDLVPWDRKKLDELEGPFFALETGGIAIDDFSFPERGVLIVGSEELGVSPSALAVAETSLGRVSIPTIGAKGSLNVSVALGIAMHEWYKKTYLTRWFSMLKPCEKRWSKVSICFGDEIPKSARIFGSN